jgi:hypothetical protein
MENTSEITIDVPVGFTISTRRLPCVVGRFACSARMLLFSRRPATCNANAQCAMWQLTQAIKEGLSGILSILDPTPIPQGAVSCGQGIYHCEKRVDKWVWVEPALLLCYLCLYSSIVTLDTKGDLLRTRERDRERPTASDRMH